MVTIRKASMEDAPLITKTRRLVWEQTYRGIYPDHKLDDYDFAFYMNRDKTLLESPEQHFYLFMDQDDCVGYFSYGPSNYGPYKDFDLCLNSLYLLNGYKGKGFGRMAITQLRNFAAEQGIGRFFCGCNVHNVKAQGFYRHMGGVPGTVSTGHVDKSDDIIHFEFYLGE